MKFIFDLDGTVTKYETLPIIATHFKVGDQLDEMTRLTIDGQIPFIESFIKRTAILGSIPEDQIADLLAETPLSEEILQFIHKHPKDCCIATGNYRGWIKQLVAKLPCEVFASEGFTDSDGRLKITSILKKEDIIKEFQNQGHQTVFIGEGHNDAMAMRCADISIGCGVVHQPAQSVLEVADYLVFSYNSLTRLLTQLSSTTCGKSVVLASAGIGSRLGLNINKGLLKIEEHTLLERNLSLFSDVDDIRVVVGYESAAVIKNALGVRQDIIFVCNHDYFHTKTGHSIYLGARHANEFIITWDCDLLIHPEDAKICLNHDGEFIAGSNIRTEDSVFLQLDSSQLSVISFSRDSGVYEWSGPACIKKSRFNENGGHVFEQISPWLPLPFISVQAQDIDTYQDYLSAKELIRTWSTAKDKRQRYYRNMADSIRDPKALRNKAPDSSEWDKIFFIKAIERLGSKSALLDLGSGSGLLLNQVHHLFSNVTAVEREASFS